MNYQMSESPNKNGITPTSNHRGDGPLIFFVTQAPIPTVLSKTDPCVFIKLKMPGILQQSLQEVVTMRSLYRFE